MCLLILEPLNQAVLCIYTIYFCLVQKDHFLYVTCRPNIDNTCLPPRMCVYTDVCFKTFAFVYAGIEDPLYFGPFYLPNSTGYFPQIQAVYEIQTSNFITLLSQI